MQSRAFLIGEKLPVDEIQIVACAALDGAEVAFVPDALGDLIDTRGRYAGRVAYRESELRRLLETSPDQETFRFLHAVKSEFGGVYEGLYGQNPQRGVI